MNKVVDRLYEVVVGMVNVFLIDDPESGLILIDTGTPWSKGRILKAVKALGRQPGDLKHILLTHADVDHVGSLGALAAETGAQTYAGAAAADYAERQSGPPHVPFVMDVFGSAIIKIGKKPHITHRLTDGELIDIAGGIQAIHTPGHSPDNFSFFWEREKVLFAADLLNTAFSNGLGLTPKMITHSMDDAKKSAKRVLALHPAYICVGHGGFVDSNKQPELIKKLNAALG